MFNVTCARDRFCEAGERLLSVIKCFVSGVFCSLNMVAMGLILTRGRHGSMPDLKILLSARCLSLFP